MPFAIVERGISNRKVVEMGLVQMAKAIAEGEVKPSVSDLDRLIRLEEFLREERVAREQTRVAIDWRIPGDSDKERDGEGNRPETQQGT